MPPPDDNLASVLSRLADVLDHQQRGASGNSQIVDVNRQGVEYLGLLASYLATLAGTFPSSIVAPQNGGTGVANAAGRTITLGGALNYVGVKTVATLPSAVTSGAGAFGFVSDANATTFASIVAAGGANFVPVFSDATNWRIG